MLTRTVRIPHLFLLVGMGASVGTAQTPFGPKVVPVPAGPQQIAIGDVLGDAHEDIVCGSSDGSISVCIGTGSGEFQAPIVMPALQPYGFSRIQLADVDGDGDLDIIALGDSTLLATSSVVVLRNQSHQTFAPAVTFSAGSFDRGMCAGDLNGDGKPEIAVCNAGSFDTVRISVNTGSGTYLAPQVLSLGGGMMPNDIAFADVDHDGDLDIVTANISHSIAVIRNLGGQGFAAPALFPTPSSNRRVQVGDWNNDGFPDLAVADFDAHIDLLMNDGMGAFGATTIVSLAGLQVYGLATGDLDGDGRPDIVGADYTGGLSVLIGYGGGAFVAAEGVFAGGQGGVALADLDGDGRLDVAVADYNGSQVSILSGDGHGGFHRPALSLCSSLAAFRMGDLDGDGRPDLVGADGSNAFLCVRVALAGGGFGPPTTIPCAAPVRDLRLAHVNADPFLDAVVYGLDGTIRVQFGDGSGGFSAPTAPVLLHGTHQLAVGDVNGDGLADVVLSFSDLVMGQYLLSDTDVYFGDGSGGFTYSTDLMQDASSILLADFDEDGVDDIVFSAAGQLILWTHVGSAGFATSTIANVQPDHLGVGDVNADGHLDLYATIPGIGVDVFVGDGTGHFAPTVLTAPGQPTDLVVGDFNGDGRDDVLAQEYLGIRCLESDGTALIDRGSIVSGSGTHGMALADVNGDQRLELITSGPAVDALTIVENRGPVDGPIVYCTSKTTSNGCVPVMVSSGGPSTTATSGFVLTCQHAINNKRGLLIYSLSGRATTPFQGGTLCLHAPILRTPGTLSGGNPPPDDCSGAFSIDFNAYAHGLAGGHPHPSLILPGTAVTAQWWGRDPFSTLPGQSMLSNAIDFVMRP